MCSYFAPWQPILVAMPAASTPPLERVEGIGAHRVPEGITPLSLPVESLTVCEETSTDAGTPKQANANVPIGNLETRYA
jgi:hypothetical protein